ncbi:MAG: two-component system OmpR family response regulator PhoP [Gammaproteobacteria bacterium]|nr:MAG: two-component system OmpR family response regulator PhoP [Gammaproteobacteria bacterium]TND04319.1 MAG: two-component system, OmpR family, response regulator PhoP [Gammaproteobacteria bacterium]
MRVLVVEDEAELREQLVKRLGNEGYAVDGAANGEDGLYLGNEYPFDIAVIDLGLPTLSGIEVIKRLRKEGRSFPILILTARGRWEEKVEGLEAGADDYMVKPFRIEELLARLNALLRRAAGWTQPELRCGPLSLHTTTREVTIDDRGVELTAFEFRTLQYLVMNAGKVVSKAELTEHLYAQDFDRDSNVIEVFIRRLRSKLDPDGVLNPIETLRGSGYRMTLPRPASD